jgi:hypothetical protein
VLDRAEMPRLVMDTIYVTADRQVATLDGALLAN